MAEEPKLGSEFPFDALEAALMVLRARGCELNSQAAEAFRAAQYFQAQARGITTPNTSECTQKQWMGRADRGLDDYRRLSYAALLYMRMAAWLEKIAPYHQQIEAVVAAAQAEKAAQGKEATTSKLN